MAIIIPHQLPLAPHPLSPLPFSADRFPIHSGPLFCFQQSAFLFPAIFSPVPFGLLSCFLCSAILFPLVRLPVPFVSLACSFWSVSLFPLFRFFVSFGPFSCSLCSASSFLLVRYSLSFVPRSCSFRPASPFPLFRSFVFFVPPARFLLAAPPFPPFRFLFPLVWFYEALPRSQLLSLLVLSPLLSGIFVPLKSDTRLSVLKTMPFNVRDNALLAPRQRPSTFKNTPFSSRLRMCLISCQLQVPLRFIPSSQRRDFRVCSC